MIKKAKGSDVQQLFDLAYHHEQMEGDTSQQRRLVRYAADNGLQAHLPEDAHGLMHEMGVQHNHAETPNDENGLHVHTVVKSFNPKAFEGTIVKSWGDGDTVHFEGWLSTPAKDMEKDVTEPEAFMHGMDSYFSKRAPLSLEHNGKSLPSGHLQKGAVLRDGKVLKAATHPSDPAEFEYLPTSGSGVWVRGVANEEPGISALRKGNIGGMSFIGNATEYEPLPGGRNRYTKIDPWIESTIAAYPINHTAVIAVAKAFGLEENNMPLSLEEILAEAAAKVEAEKQAQGQATITKADLGNVLGELKTSISNEVKALIETEVKKAAEDAATAVRREGVGRKGEVQQGQSAEKTFEDDPLGYTIKKAAALEEDSSSLTPQERALLNQLFYRVLSPGLTEDAE